MADRPVHEVRLGRIKATIWVNKLEEGGVRHNVTIARIYKDESGWKQTGSFGRDDLPLVSKVADLAHLWIYEQGNSPESATDSEPSKENSPSTDHRKQNSARR